MQLHMNTTCSPSLTKHTHTRWCNAMLVHEILHMSKHTDAHFHVSILKCATPANLITICFCLFGLAVWYLTVHLVYITYTHIHAHTYTYILAHVQCSLIQLNGCCVWQHHTDTQLVTCGKTSFNCKHGKFATQHTHNTHITHTLTIWLQ